jgi:uncharacterized protein with HEPN domain
VIRSTRALLHDIDFNIAVVLDITKGRTQNHLENDTALRYVVLHALMIIAGAVRQLPDEALAPHPVIPWKDIIRLGRVIEQEYDRVDPDVIWRMVKVHLPALRPVIKTKIADQDQPALPL